ncbi:hypothetical protein BU24DRAFT_380691 [Aaosphaeria arxii CBS 175.79]|uniref:Polyprenal reductase n=1 Tax=Aaosphaeria arxii CBS 175.79 TaxID=1450172 RepID=A0A6A5X8Y4_9PLEO|nr:uncharacterized protein BU24DRAFT_380691 [Aaosphaeria arxii CBS 175.79]KAF2009267.1 hypothetical protein BU24DRAFT_380691 [Aaosphaeria arxii CBS 175.79]
MDHILSITWRWLLDPVLLLRAFYLAASAIILVIQALPALSSRFLAYGSRATPTPTSSSSSSSSSTSAPEQPTAKPTSAFPFAQFLDYLATLTVPHNYFTHFYILSVLCSLIWGYLLFLPSPFPSFQLSWLLMLLQGVRRLLESHAYTSSSSSKSRMWFGHWVLGLAFYLTVNIAVWIEDYYYYYDYDHGAHSSSSSSLFKWKSALLVPLILTSHALQNSYHAYLFRLRTTTSTKSPSDQRTYRLPTHPLFPSLLCPHYTCEIAIYLLLSLLAAPHGQTVNYTLLAATTFVAVNLGVTAKGTKEWYLQKFGEDRVAGRTRMIPWVW